MPTPRFEVSVETLNGKIYVIGGVDKNEYLTDIVEVYDPQTDKWSTVAPIPEPSDHTGLASYDGKLYLTGGTRAGLCRLLVLA
jgi:N-acetylneuraminic acid mutarotase